MKAVRLSSIYTLLFLAGIFFIPFNSYEGVSFLGEYSKESAALFFLAGFAVFALETLIRGKLTFPVNNAIFFFVLLFFAWCLLTFIFNLDSILDNDYKGISGIERFIRQYISLILIGFCFLLFYINTLKKLSATSLLRNIRRVFLASLVIVAIYGFFETLILVYGKSQLAPILRLFDYFPFVEVKLVGNRISSVSYETPFLAIYLITICGWMLSYIITSEKIVRFLPALVVLALTFFSGSRTGMVVISLQFTVFFGILFFIKKYRKDVIYLLSGIVVLVFALVIFSGGAVINEAKQKIDSLKFEQNLLTSISNQSRFGMQYASFEVFKDNPVLGAGYGQLAYDAYKYYPAWAITRNYEFRLNYKNQRRESFPPSYNIYLRILAECGIVGMILFLALIFLAVYRAIKMLLWGDGPLRTLGLVMLVSLIGLSLNWLQIDTFRIFGFWLCIAILCLNFEEKPPNYFFDAAIVEKPVP